MSIRATYELFKDAGLRWWDNQGMRLGASISFYTMLSLAPLVVVVMSIAALVFPRERAQAELADQMRDLAGDAGADVIKGLVESAANQPSTGVLATLMGVSLLLVGAMGVFVELQDALNTIWGVKREETSGVWAFVRARFLSFSMVLGVAFLLMVSLIVSAALSAMGKFAGGKESQLAPLLSLLHLLVSMGLLGVLFALMFKFLPDAPISWRDVWVGGLVTAALFSIGKYLIGLYLGSSTISSAYGAAGSFAVFLVWTYYSAQIFFFGAAFTRAFADRYGSRGPARRDEGAAEPPAPKKEEAALRV